MLPGVAALNDGASPIVSKRAPSTTRHSPFEINDLRAAATVVSGNCVRPPANVAQILAGNDTHRVRTPHRFGGHMDSETPVTGIQLELKWMRENDN
jgi:hypothetical protein